MSNLFSDKITIVKKERKGACASSNYGFELSKGDYIQYLDTDDLISKDKLNEQIQLIYHNGPWCIYSSKLIEFSNDHTNYNYTPKIIDKSYNEPEEWVIDAWKNIKFGGIHTGLYQENFI